MRRSDFGLACLALIIAASTVFTTSGCAEPRECGAGTALVDGACLPVCAPGTERDEASGRCVQSCFAGTHRDAASGGCLPDSAKCVSGEVWDPELQTCLEVAALCAEGTTWVAGEARCVADDDLRSAAFPESDRENDPTWGGPGSFENLLLAPEGVPITLSGTIEAPRDRNADGVVDPDVDYWLFEVDAPTVLRVRAEGLGGATSGFEIVGLMDAPFSRYAIGTTSNDVARDVFLPEAGWYAMLATDALNFVVQGAGPYHGGGDFGYFMTLTRLPIPEPTPLTFDGDTAKGAGTLPMTPPETGVMPAFYSVEAEAHTLYALQTGSTAQTGPLVPELVVVPDRSESVWSSGLMFKGFVEGQRVLLVVDPVVYFGTEAPSHEVVVARVDSQWVDTALPSTVYEQPYFNSGSTNVAAVYFGIGAQADDVVTTHVTSSTGRTCVEIFDDTLTQVYDQFACAPSAEAEARPEGRMRFVVPRTGYYSLTATDWDQAEFILGYLRHVPAHDFELSLDVSHQTPLDLGVLGGGVTASDRLEADGSERYLRLAAGDHRAFVGTVTSDFSPIVTVYESTPGRLRPATWSTPGTFLWRVDDTGAVRLGVASEEGAPGAFDLELTPLDIDDLGTVPTAGTLEVVQGLGQGGNAWLYHVGSAASGMVRLTVTPPDGVDLVVFPRDGNLSPREGAPHDEAGPGGAETLVAPAGEDGLFVEIGTADGAPLAADADVRVTAELTGAAREGAQNDHWLWSQRVPVPGAVAAAIERAGDVDWYRVEVTEQTVLTITTQGDGETPVADTWLLLANAKGQALATNDDGGVGRHARLERLFLVPGIYTLEVGADTEGTGGYLLSVTQRAP